MKPADEAQPPPTVRVGTGGDPNADPAAARAWHGRTMAGVVYANAIRQRVERMFPKPLAQSAMLFAEDLFDRMDPRDPVEEMLLTQLVLTHARVLHLTDLANRRDDADSIRTVHEYADRASNTFRRLALSLSEYRRPPVAANFTAIRQANFAAQQVIQSNETADATNELGCDPARAPALSTDGSGAVVAAGVGAAREAVAAIDRTTKRRRQG
jgi:hypothetical protein